LATDSFDTAKPRQGASPTPRGRAYGPRPAGPGEVLPPEFLIDTVHGVVHRRTFLLPSCGLDDVPRDKILEKEFELDATVVMKTRHYAACANCYVPM